MSVGPGNLWKGWVGVGVRDKERGKGMKMLRYDLIVNFTCVTT